MEPEAVRMTRSKQLEERLGAGSGFLQIFSQERGHFFELVGILRIDLHQRLVCFQTSAPNFFPGGTARVDNHLAFRKSRDLQRSLR